MTAQRLAAELDEPAFSRLEKNFAGRLVRRGDADYDAARAVWNGSIDRYPLLVARCSGVPDVRAALEFAREQNLPIAVRGGGHNIAGFGTCDDGVVIDLGPMKDVHVDPESRIAVASAGLTGGELDAATQQHGLATTLGVMSTTGIAGLTLGGGIGWLQRRLGYTCDNLAEAEVVTASGEIVRASETSEPDLFWGLRGGGGNFGIVTKFSYRLDAIGPQVFSGITAWRAEDAPDVISFFREFAKDAPDDLTAICILRTAPAAPFLPEAIHGKPIIALAGCYAGGVEEGEAVLEPLRKFGSPAGDAYGPKPYTTFQSMFDGSWAPGFRNYWKGEYLNDIPDGLVDVFAEYAVKHSSPLSDFKFPMLGGAVARVGENETACGFRSAPWFFAINTRWTDPAEDDLHIRHSRELFEAVKPYSAGGAYVNFVGDEGTDRIVESYGDERFQRLQRLKTAWDPDNVFRLNQNIPPAPDTIGATRE